MKMRLFVSSFLLLFIFFISQVNAQDETDPFLWLEDIDGAKQLEWVKAHDSTTVSALEGYPGFQEIYKENLTILNSKERIAYPSIYKNYIYNFWQDSLNERGLWRRTTLKEYLKPNPVWEKVLDIDEMSKTDSIKWVFKGANFLYPDFDRCMVYLSKGGSDAVVIREFDLKTKQFVKNGFELPEAKGSVSWIDKNTVFVRTNFGKGTLTTSGYARIVKVWKRGTGLDEAAAVFEGDSTDVSAIAYVIHTPERSYNIVGRDITFYTSDYYAYENGKLTKLDFPEDVKFDGIFKNQILLEMKTDWNVGGKIFKQGALISIDYNKFLNGDRNFVQIELPGERESIVAVATTKDFLIINKLSNVRNELYKYVFDNGRWSGSKIDAPDFGTISIGSTDDFSNKFFFTYTNFLTPTSLYFVNDNGVIEKVKSLPSFFEGKKFQVKQYEAASLDGTKIPYFLVEPKEIKYDGTNPTLLYAYGGFEISMQPSYSAVIGTAWLQKGGVYVLANLRGGGEFGPKWHLGAIKENRHKVNEDMIAVSEDLIKRKVTSPKHLGIMGGSNGGLLVGSVFVQRPELYNAVVCRVPLLDMKRYNKLLAGASWMGEYGNPDLPEEWSYIKKYSPYQNLSKDKNYPKVFFMTSTRDDRVHPGHARKMAAKMESYGKPFYYYENTEGGHSAGVTNKQIAFESALIYSYLWMQLK